MKTCVLVWLDCNDVCFGLRDFVVLTKLHSDEDKQRILETSRPRKSSFKSQHSTTRDLHMVVRASFTKQ